jgi:alpha-galactosidase/6-phospho-beta-glucosidase family protein
MSNWNKRYASEFDNLYEAIQARKSGVNLDSYVSARESGATHNEIMQAHKSGVNLDFYGSARNNGATHNGAMLRWFIK